MADLEEFSDGTLHVYPDDKYIQNPEAHWQHNEACHPKGQGAPADPDPFNRHHHLSSPT